MSFDRLLGLQRLVKQMASGDGFLVNTTWRWLRLLLN